MNKNTFDIQRFSFKPLVESEQEENTKLNEFVDARQNLIAKAKEADHEIEQEIKQQAAQKSEQLIDIEIVKKEEYERGYNQATKEYEVKLSQLQNQNKAILENINNGFKELDHKLDAKENEITSDIKKLSLNLAKKITGQILDDFKIEVINESLEQVLKDINIEHKFIIHLAHDFESLKDQIYAKYPKLNIEFKFDQKNSPQTIKIEWEEGSFIKDYNSIIAKIEQMILG